MASSRLLLRLASNTRSNPRLTSNIFFSNSSSSSRCLHTSSSQYAKKKKQKGPIEDDLFDEDAEDDLFGSASQPAVSTKQTQTTVSTKAPLNQKGPKNVQQALRKEPKRESEIDLQKKEEERLKEAERVTKLNQMTNWIKNAVGQQGKDAHRVPRQNDLLQLVKLTKTANEWQSLIGILQQWRTWPTRTLKEVIEHTIIERAIATGHAAALLPVLEHHPVYGLSVSSPSNARALLKALVSPRDIYPPSYSPSNTAGTEDDPAGYQSRLDDALRLTQILATTTVRVPIQASLGSPKALYVDGKANSKSGKPIQPISLSPTKDLVSGSILLSALLRVYAPSSTPNPEHKDAIVDLATALHTAMIDGSLVLSSVKKELEWAGAAVKESLAALELVEGEMGGVKSLLEDAKEKVENALEERKNRSGWDSVMEVAMADVAEAGWLALNAASKAASSVVSDA